MEKRKIINKLNGVALIGNKNGIEDIIVNGFNDFENKIRHTEDSNFWICSISKMFASIGINQLCERGLIDKNDFMTKYIDKYFSDTNITIYHLLTHTSGIPDFTIDRKDIDWTKNYSPDYILTLMNRKGLNFEPGSKWRYGNTGYYILALIIEKVTGMKYEHYIKENIFDIVKMDNTFFAIDDNKNVVNANIKGKHNSNFNPGLLFGSGDIVSNVKDLYKFSKAILDNKLIKKETLEEMSKPVFEKSTFKYGEGLYLNNHFNTKMLGHLGLISMGFSTQLSIYPEKEIITIVLTNDRKKIHPLVIPDLNGKYIDSLIGEEIFNKKIGFIKKAYFFK